jgi:PAS domain S-box-containing protein
MSEQRLKFLVSLADRLRSLSEPVEITVAAQEALGQYLRVSRVGYGEVEETARYFTTERNWTDGTVSHHIGTHDLAGFGPEIHDAIKRGETLVVEDVSTDRRTNSPDHLAAFDFLETASVVTVSLIKRGRLVAALYVHSRVPRRWDESEVKLIEDVAERTWDAIQRARSEKALRKSEERLHLALEASVSVGTWDWDMQSNLLYGDERLARLFGLEPQEVLAGIPQETFIESIHPEDREEVSRSIGQAVASGGTYTAEYRTIDGRGSVHWVYARGRCYHHEGRPVRFPGAVMDITDRKRAEEHQQLLINELNHRVKNTLATVQSIASQTLRNADTAEDARAAMEARLLALSRAHNVLTRENWESAGLREIAAEAIAPYRHERENRLRVEGPDVRLSPRMALAIAMALQELATNAVKYGALSNATGEVCILWTAHDRRLHLTWTENGGPPVETPTRRGFGTRLIERSLAQDLNGDVTISYRPQGVVCTVDAPIT